MDTDEQIGKLWGALREAKANVAGEIKRIIAIIFGENGDGGINKRLTDVENDNKRIWESIRQYKYEERRKSCYGLEAIKEMEKEESEEEEGETKVKVAQINMKAVIWGQVISSLCALLAALVVLFK